MVLQPYYHLGGHPLDLLQQLYVFVVLGSPGLDIVLQVGEYCTSLTLLEFFDADQHAVDSVGCKCTLLTHVSLMRPSLTCSALTVGEIFLPLLLPRGSGM